MDGQKIVTKCQQCLVICDAVLNISFAEDQYEKDTDRQKLVTSKVRNITSL